MTVSKEWLERRIAFLKEAAANCLYGEDDECLDDVEALCELLSRRAADEGAVTVEGYADLRVSNGSPWNTLRGAANMMRVFMEGIDGDIPVTVAIRRKP